MPSGASAKERLLTNPANPARKVLERMRSSMGCFTDEEVRIRTGGVGGDPDSR
jgi:hypothetical protein